MASLRCFNCKRDVPRVNADTRAVLCSDCTQRLVGPPDVTPAAPRLSYEERKERKAERILRKAKRIAEAANRPKGRGRGWHLKRRFEHDGKFYSYGEEITKEEYAELVYE